MLTLTPAPMNVVSVHVYEKAKGVYPGARSTADVLTSVTRAAAGAGMPVFLGEFPVRDPGQAQEFLQAIEAAHVPLSAFWVFDLPAQEGTMNVSFTNQRAFAIDMVAKANRRYKDSNSSAFFEERDEMQASSENQIRRKRIQAQLSS